MASTRSRTYVFTVYGFTQRPSALPDGVEWLCFQLEVCPTTSRHHYQGIIRFPSVKSLEQAKTRVTSLFACSPPHLEVCRSAAASRKYCCKDDTRSDLPDSGPHEFGSPPSQGKRTDLDAVKELLDKPESTMREVAEQHFRPSLDIIAASPPTGRSPAHAAGRLRPRRLFTGDLPAPGSPDELSRKLASLPIFLPTPPPAVLPSTSMDTTVNPPSFLMTSSDRCAVRPCYASSIDIPLLSQFEEELWSLLRPKPFSPQIYTSIIGGQDEDSEEWLDGLNNLWD